MHKCIFEKHSYPIKMKRDTYPSLYRDYHNLVGGSTDMEYINELSYCYGCIGTEYQHHTDFILSWIKWKGRLYVIKCSVVRLLNTFMHRQKRQGLNGFDSIRNEFQYEKVFLEVFIRLCSLFLKKKKFWYQAWYTSVFCASQPRYNFICTDMCC